MYPNTAGGLGENCQEPRGRCRCHRGRHRANEGIKAFSETDFTEDLKGIEVPTLVMHGDDDQIVPYTDAALLSAKLIRRAALKIYPGFPHGMLTIHAGVINQDLLTFIKG
jgi:non-heme chloroperoxidase